MRCLDAAVHLPAAAVHKDGPSAGITLATALVSLFTGRAVRGDTAMTGELSLRGLVLPIGGVKDKLIAAHQTGAACFGDFIAIRPFSLDQVQRTSVLQQLAS